MKCCRLSCENKATHYYQCAYYCTECIEDIRNHEIRESVRECKK